VFPVLPTVAGHCVRVRVKLGSNFSEIRLQANRMWSSLITFNTKITHLEDAPGTPTLLT
jgi:hypothetical protein